MEVRKIKSMTVVELRFHLINFKIRSQRDILSTSNNKILDIFISINFNAYIQLQYKKKLVFKNKDGWYQKV